MLWKHFFLIVIGAYLVLNILNSGPLQPSNAEERVIMSLTKVALAALGLWMIVLAVATVGCAAIVAGYLPARGAGRSDPALAFRAE